MTADFSQNVAHIHRWQPWKCTTSYKNRWIQLGVMDANITTHYIVNLHWFLQSISSCTRMQFHHKYKLCIELCVNPVYVQIQNHFNLFKTHTALAPNFLQTTCLFKQDLHQTTMPNWLESSRWMRRKMEKAAWREVNCWRIVWSAKVRILSKSLLVWFRQAPMHARVLRWCLVHMSIVFWCWKAQFVPLCCSRLSKNRYAAYLTVDSQPLLAIYQMRARPR
jgi:hypothetical protein